MPPCFAAGRGSRLIGLRENAQGRENWGPALNPKLAGLTWGPLPEVKGNGESFASVEAGDRQVAWVSFSYLAIRPVLRFFSFKGRSWSSAAREVRGVRPPRSLSRGRRGPAANGDAAALGPTPSPRARRPPRASCRQVRRREGSLASQAPLTTAFVFPRRCVAPRRAPWRRPALPGPHPHLPAAEGAAGRRLGRNGSL